jgi:hypothetical protein
MNRTGHLCVAACVAFFAALTACGDKDPAAMNGAGGAAGTPAGGAGGAPAGGAGGIVTDDAGNPTDVVVDPGDLPAATGDYLPFKVGNSWTYLVTEINHPNQNKLHVITRMEAVGGTGPFKDSVAFRVETQKTGGTAQPDGTISWQGIEGNRIVRYRETSCQAGSVTIVNGSIDKCSVNEEDWWMPGRVVLDSQPTTMPYAAGLKWTEMYTEWVTTTSFKTNPATMNTVTGAKSDVWEVVNPNTVATTPAGTFTGCAIIKKTSMANATKQYTYCKGVGKVKEEGASASAQTETLTAFTVM